MKLLSKIKSKPYIVAEIGINHNGYLDLAKKLILEAKKAGADAVKFQKREVKDLVNYNMSPGKSREYLSKSAKDIKKTKTKFGGWVYPDTRLELSANDYKEIKKYTKKLKIDLVITPWDEQSMLFIKKLGIKFVKIASIDGNNYHFCEFIAKQRLPTIISTGMCTFKEILNTQKIFKKYNTPHIFLHCTSAYPSEEKDKNLNCIPKLQKLLKDHVGFSGHGTGVIGAVGATILGAKIIEKHVTLNKKMHGPDHAASLEFQTFKNMVNLCRKAYVSLGKSEKKFLKSEQLLHNILIRKFVIRKKLKRNMKLNFKNIKTALVYNKKGILPKYYYKILGRKIKKDLSIAHIVNWNDFI